MKRSILTILLLAASAVAFADDFNYTYLQVTYGNVDLDGATVNGDGLGLSGAFGITDSLHIVGGYQTTDFGSFANVDQWSLGLGVHSSLTDSLDAVAEVSYVNATLDPAGFPSLSDDGFGLTVGGRLSVTPLVEINAGISYVDLSDSGSNTGFGGGVLFNLMDNFSVGLAGSWDDDASVYSLGARLYF